MSSPTIRMHRPETTPIVATAVVMLVVLTVTILFVQDAMGAPSSAGVIQTMTCALAGIGAVIALRAARRSAGVEQRVWRLMSMGLASWTLGIVPYLTFLATGGDIRSPEAWSQIGFLLAYPFWYRALWLVRQPVLGASPLRRMETWLVEAAVFVMIGAAAAGVLWHDDLPVANNIAQLIPLALDLLLLHSVYLAVRRSSVTHRTAFIWLAYGFTALALTDGAISALVTSAPFAVLGLVMMGYPIALCLITIATTRPLRMTEARANLSSAPTALLAALGVALCGAASAAVPETVRPAIWVVAGLLFIRLWVLLREHGQSETDALTGFLETRAFTRHLAGITQLASPDRQAVLIAVELDEFTAWQAQNTAGAGDALIADVAVRLEASLAEGGAWARVGDDRFIWVGGAANSTRAREMAELVRAAAAENEAGIASRASFVMIPEDAANERDAVAAAEESLAAARTGRRRVVAFDHGRLDGVEYSAGYTASLAQRRRTVLSILHAPEAIDILVQPIVSLVDGATVGYEALSRFRALPQRPPDRWIAEAHAVGLGLEIEVECVRRACRARPLIEDGAYLSLNMSPDAVLAPEMEDALGPGSLDWLVIEITEHEAVSDYARLASRLADYRGRGALVAIDDTGAGHASMRHVAQLGPDYIKVDRSLIHDLHLDHAKRALVRSMVTLEKELGAQIIAEGIERVEELRALRALDVPLGQGYLLARPAPHPPTVRPAASWPALTAEPA